MNIIYENYIKMLKEIKKELLKYEIKVKIYNEINTYEIHLIISNINDNYKHFSYPNPCLAYDFLYDILKEKKYMFIERN